MMDFIKSLYGIQPTDRVFPVTKHYLRHEMERGCKATGVKHIRIHDLRHSHVSLLIEMGFSAVAIADWVGHESIDITYRYAHMFPSRQVEIADNYNWNGPVFNLCNCLYGFVSSSKSCAESRNGRASSCYTF